MNREEKIEAIASAIAALAAEHGEDNLFTREEVAERCDLTTTEIALIGVDQFDKLQAAVLSKDKAQIGTAYDAVHDSCKSCHKTFKAR